MFFLQTYEATTWPIFLIEKNFPFLTKLPYPTPLNQIMVYKNFFFKISVICFLFRRKNNREIYWSPLKIGHFSFFFFFFFSPIRYLEPEPYSKPYANLTRHIHSQNSLFRHYSAIFRLFSTLCIVCICRNLVYLESWNI